MKPKNCKFAQFTENQRRSRSKEVYCLKWWRLTSSIELDFIKTDALGCFSLTKLFFAHSQKKMLLHQRKGIWTQHTIIQKLLQQMLHDFSAFLRLCFTQNDKGEVWIWNFRNELFFGKRCSENSIAHFEMFRYKFYAFGKLRGFFFETIENKTKTIFFGSLFVLCSTCIFFFQSIYLEIRVFFLWDCSVTSVFKNQIVQIFSSFFSLLLKCLFDVYCRHWIEIQKTHF